MNDTTGTDARQQRHGVGARVFRTGLATLLISSALLVPTPEADATGSPANGKVIFSALLHPNGADLDIFGMNHDGTGVVDITNSPGVDDVHPTFSPDGTKIAFVRNAYREGPPRLAVMNPNGTDVTYVAAADNLVSAGSSISWSPDGTQIAFTGLSAGYQDIYIAQTNGLGQATPLTSTYQLDELNPAFSPDGTKIAYEANDNFGPRGIWTMNPDGSGQSTLINDFPVRDSNPAWSPDGTKILFRSSSAGNEGNIAVMDANGSNPVLLTNYAAPDATSDGRWSPDGTRIVYATNLATAPGVYEMDAQGSNPTQVLSDTAAPNAQGLDWGGSLDPVQSSLDLAPAGALSATRSDGVSAAALLPTFPVAASWGTSDWVSGVSSYDVRVRKRAWNASSAGSYSPWLNGTTATGATRGGILGSTYCFSQRARDVAMNLSGWSPDGCAAVPLDDPSLKISGPWARLTDPGYFEGTLSQSSVKGAMLIRSGAYARQVSVLVGECSTCGTIKVFWNTQVLGTYSLSSAVTRKAVLLTVATFPSVQSGTIRIKVISSNKPVQIDGLALTSI